MDEVMNQENAENNVATYDQFVGADIGLPGEWGRKMIARVTKCVKDNKGNTRGSKQTTLYA